MIDFILILILLGIAAAIIFYLIREKKRGVTCIGCSHAKYCAKAKSGGCSCAHIPKK
ncbi:MAG: FeoB-associated Cys-rich membrane protein [Clostridia bacterium]|jgi:hypothetical protein|nr:FeoB-associated Cys-rich membrane protein [Clostridia bacterium]